MGIFSVPIGIGNPEGGNLHWVDALVDTGATHSMAPASLLEQLLNLRPLRGLEFELGDGTIATCGFGQARLRIGQEAMTCPFVFGPEDEYLLGATTLESFNLIPDTTDLRLIPAPRKRVRPI